MKTFNQHLGVEAYEGLYHKTPRKKMVVEYSGRFRDFGANITSNTYTNSIVFRLSKEFLELGDEIQIGVMQHLLCKLYKSKKKQTLEMDLYNSFLKKVGEYESAGGGEIEDAELQAAFEKINVTYFDNYMLQPTIKWKGNSCSHLGLYSFSNDTVTISNALRGAGEVMEYVLYHELLHKKHKFDHKNGRTHSHTPAFRKDERKFVMSDGSDPEKTLHAYCNTKARERMRAPRKKAVSKKPKTIVGKLLDYF